MNEFKNYTRNPTQVSARIYEPGDEDGFMVDRKNGKQAVVEKDDKSYEKYAERMDYSTVAPYVFTATGPALIYPDSYVIFDRTTGRKAVMDRDEFQALHTEGELDESRIITLN